jgi:hypothetical protein
MGMPSIAQAPMPRPANVPKPPSAPAGDMGGLDFVNLDDVMDKKGKGKKKGR